MQSVCVYYVDLLNDMKTTVKTFWISMLLILTCSISGKAVDFAKVCVKFCRNLQRFCYIVFMFFYLIQKN